jgi:hypothetical protein
VRVRGVRMQPDSVSDALAHALTHSKVRWSIHRHASPQIERSLCLRVRGVRMQPDSGSDCRSDALVDALAHALAHSKVRRSIHRHASSQIERS